MCKLYHEDIKDRFLKTYENPGTQIKYKTDLIKLGEYEKRLDKDLYEFTPDDFTDMFQGGLNRESASSLASIRSVLASYLKWSRREGYIVDNMINLKILFPREELRKSVSNIVKEKKYLTEDEVKDICERKLRNAQDAAVVALLFSGVKGEKSQDIVDIKVSDVDFENNLVKVNDSKIELEPWVTKILEKADEQETYQKQNGNFDTKIKAPEVKIIKTNYLIRYAVPRKDIVENTKLPRLNIQKRIDDIGNWLEYSFLTPTSIWKSGIFAHMKREEDKKGEELTKQDVERILAEYGLNQSRYFDYLEEYKEIYAIKG